MGRSSRPFWSGMAIMTMQNNKRRSFDMRNIGMVLLGALLILYGLVEIIGLSFKGLDLLMGILALVSGILIILRR